MKVRIQPGLPFVAAEVEVGLYEHLVTQDLQRALSRLPETRIRAIGSLPEADAHEVLGRHLGAEIARVLRDLPSERRQEASSVLPGC